MAAETVVHARIKRRIEHALGAALAQGGHACEVFVSGPKVRIDADTAFEPDVVVSCAADGLLAPEPLIVVEVLPPSTREKAGRRLDVHHRRAPGEQAFRTSIARDGILRIDPPGAALDLEAIYAASGV